MSPCMFTTAFFFSFCSLYLKATFHVYKILCFMFSFLESLKYVALLPYAVDKSDENIILFFLYKLLCLYAWISKKCFLYHPVLLDDVLVFTILNLFAKVNGVIFQYRCSNFLKENLLTLWIFIFVLFYCFHLFLQYKLCLCWIFFSYLP